jgi:putative ABC transport system substrate-binding protein
MIQRRAFITLLGGAAAAWPFAARAQQPAVPVIGFLSSSAEMESPRLAAFRRALNESGYVEGRNVLIEYRWADNQYDRLPALAADLVQRRVAIIVAAGNSAAPAAKAATTTLPIVFGTGSDPVQLGLVSNLARPGGNVTGITLLNQELNAKRLEILRELLPNVTVIGLLVNPNNPTTDPTVRELREVSQSRGSALRVVAVSSQSDLDAAIANLVQAGAGSFMHAIDSVFPPSFDRLAALASHYRIPAIYSAREAVDNGGLMSYGGRPSDEWRLMGQYTARVLKGERPGDLPVQQATRVDFLVNLKTAKALGLTIPLALLARADEVIE